MRIGSDRPYYGVDSLLIFHFQRHYLAVRILALPSSQWALNHVPGWGGLGTVAEHHGISFEGRIVVDRCQCNMLGK
jgi:hypothetical protein